MAAHFWLISALLQAGNSEGAIQAFENLPSISAYNPFFLGFLGSFYARTGRVSEALKHLEELQEISLKSYVPPSSFSWIYFGLGEIEKGFDWLEKAVDGHDSMILHLHVDPVYDPLRSHPRYAALLRKMNLEP